MSKLNDHDGMRYLDVDDLYIAGNKSVVENQLKFEDDKEDDNDGTNEEKENSSDSDTESSSDDSGQQARSEEDDKAIKELQSRITEIVEETLRHVKSARSAAKAYASRYSGAEKLIDKMPDNLDKEKLADTRIHWCNKDSQEAYIKLITHCLDTVCSTPIVDQLNAKLDTDPVLTKQFGKVKKLCDSLEGVEYKSNSSGDTVRFTEAYTKLWTKCSVVDALNVSSIKPYLRNCNVLAKSLSSKDLANIDDLLSYSEKIRDEASGEELKKEYKNKLIRTVLICSTIRTASALAMHHCNMCGRMLEVVKNNTK